MDIEEAKKILKCCMNDDCTKCEYADVFDCVKGHNEAIEVVLSELEKKDRIIKEMAKHITSYSNIDVIEYFTNKVEQK